MPSCPHCSQAFDITESDRAFYEKISPVFGGKKEPVSPPTLCPHCRMQRRLAFRNERALYHRKCDLTGRQIISMYRPESTHPVYEKKEWFSDRWDPLTYGRPFDRSKPFFEQFASLLSVVPRMSIVQQGTMENSDYCNRASNDKNCYLLTSANFDEDSYYSSAINDCKSCVDGYNIHRCELCYECHDCYDCYGSGWLEECHHCIESFFLKNCIGCTNCLFCTNLHQKQYCIFNVQYSKEEYDEQMKVTILSSAKTVELLKEKFAGIKQTMIVKESFGTRNEASSGNYLDNCKNARLCFESRELEDCTYVQTVLIAKDCMDFCHWGRNVELIYETHGVGYGCRNLLFANESWDQNQNLLYCDQCMHCSHLFGCSGLRYKEYCILNKQYTKEEYEELVPTIIGHMRKTKEWGEFFPVNLSPFAYNETLAQDFVPITKQEALSHSWQWHDDDEKESQYMGPAFEIPDDIHTVPDDILKQILRCSVTGKPYRIIPQELKFYRQMGVPIPRKCPDQRHQERMALRNPRRLWERACGKCGKGISTSYAPDRPEVVHCEKCYLASVY
jgi:hypothetical protein